MSIETMFYNNSSMNMDTNMFSPLFNHRCSQIINVANQIKSKSTSAKTKLQVLTNKYIHTTEDLQLVILLTVYYAHHKCTYRHFATQPD